MEWIDANLLSAIVFLPIVSVLPLMALPAFGVRLSDGFWRATGLVSSLLGFALALRLWSRFDATAGGLAEGAGRGRFGTGRGPGTSTVHRSLLNGSRYRWTLERSSSHGERRMSAPRDAT